MRNIKNYIIGETKYGKWVRFNGFFLKGCFIPDFMELSESDREFLIDIMVSPRILPFNVEAIGPLKNKLDRLAQSRLIIKTKISEMHLYSPNPTIYKPPKSYGSKR